MSLEQRVQSVICQALEIDASDYNEDLSAGDIPEWDSLAHVRLLSAVEAEFAIVFDVGDAIDIESVGDLLDAVKRYTEAKG